MNRSEKQRLDNLLRGAPMEPRAVETKQEATLIPSVAYTTQSLNEAVLALEALAADLCAPYPTPGPEKLNESEGIFGTIRAHISEQQQLIDRISTAVRIIRSAL